MAKISNSQGVDIQSEGWADEEEMYWVCKTCFDDFMEMYQWNLQ
jgi:hypothetical protein